MARKKKSEEENQLARECKQRNRLYSIKNELEGGRMKGFDQVFAIIGMSIIAKQMNMSYGTFKRRINNPTEFSIGEMERLADLFDVSYTVIHAFTRKCIEQDKIHHSKTQ